MLAMKTERRLTCPSARYVAGQPFVARKSWHEIFDEHVQAYGGALTAEESARMATRIVAFEVQ